MFLRSWPLIDNAMDDLQCTRRSIQGLIPDNGGNKMFTLFSCFFFSFFCSY